MMELDIEETISQLKKIFSNSTPSEKLYPITDEQKSYVRKLNIIFGGFHDYLKKITQIKSSIEAIMEDIEMFLQIFHLDYSEKLLSELDDEELIYYLQDFLPRKWLNFSKNKIKSICKSLKIFTGFLSGKLGYYSDDGLYNKMMDTLDANEIINTVDWHVEANDDDEIDNLFTNPNGISLKLEGINDDGIKSYSFIRKDKTRPSAMEVINLLEIIRLKMENSGEKSLEVGKKILQLMGVFQDVRETEKKSEMELKKDQLMKSINLDGALNQWYTIEEIKVGILILKNVYKNFYELRNLNKNGLLAAIDYALCEIFSKKTTQSEIAKRQNTSPATLIKNRNIIAPCIPLDYFYSLFISKSDIELKKEKTFLFKITNFYNARNWSKYELAESNTLDDLHQAIQSFMDADSYDDHLYSFFMNGKEWDDNTEYAGPIEYQQERNSKLTNVSLKELNLGYKQKFLYLYDYGDSMKYYITIIGLGIYDDEKTYPHLIK